MSNFIDTPFILRVAAVALIASLAACDGSRAAAASTSPGDTAFTAAAVITQPAEGSSIYQLAGTWRNQDGDSVALSSLAGRVRIVSMVYTNCHSSCPLIVADMKRIEAALDETERDAVGFVLISLDPAHDTPARLTEWAASTGLDRRYWTLLSGDANTVREVSAALDIRYETQPNGELAHSNSLSVLDRAGNIVHTQVGLGDTPLSIKFVESLVR